MMRRSSGSCTSFFPGCDVKYLAHAPALGRGPLSTRALNPVWGETGERDVWGSASGRARTCMPVGDAF